jgi:hypothetical protein
MAIQVLQICFLVMATTHELSPITVNLLDGRDYAVFLNRLHPGNHVGYRFHEHTPIKWGEVPDLFIYERDDVSQQPLYEQHQLKQPGSKTHSLIISSDGWEPQKWIFHLSPTNDGIDLLWIIETSSEGLPQYYGVQQCFRLGGVSNQLWRREIAETTAFSEYDLWDITEKDFTQKTSLTYILRNGVWDSLPALRDPVGARTPIGFSIDSEISGDQINSMTAIGPYKARMLEPIDNGLITRVDKKHSWICGIYWERTSHVTVHHPADCLHCIVNIGGIPPHSKRVIRGKIYWFHGTVNDLLNQWRLDFQKKY